MIRSGHRFNFGKYRGRFVDDVASRDPGYIYFCENELGYEFTPRVKRLCGAACARRRHLRSSEPAFI